jgi:hypothetical protein
VTFESLRAISLPLRKGGRSAICNDEEFDPLKRVLRWLLAAAGIQRKSMQFLA